MDRINLTWKYVNDIKGDFIVPSYQRGYRWDKTEINRLLDDVYTLEDKNYCLQPIVVKKIGDNKYELIDGQQRLTTIYLIYKYMHNRVDEIEIPEFSLNYDTRKASTTFLQNIDFSLRNDSIDVWFMANAYECIDKWFSAQKGLKFKKMTKINEYFLDKVKIIWYEIDTNDKQDAIKLFTRLNIGKIPLTSAELIKAMFMRKNDSNIIRQDEISLQWDNIERDLHNESFWYFLTNYSTKDYPTRIDLVLDLMSKKPADTKDKYYTYFYFDELHNPKDIEQKPQSLNEIWKNILLAFDVLKDWYSDHTFYHKIGYLIASKSKTLANIFDEYDIFDKYKKNLTKNEFIKKLDEYIKESVKTSDYSNLVYGTNSALIYKILLLFNVESVRKIDGQSRRFPFNKFKFNAKNKSLWSLEHIHAQNSQGLDEEKQWLKWLELHKPPIEALNGNNIELINEIQTHLTKGKINNEQFQNLHKQIVDKLSADNGEYIDTIANLALLNVGDNSALRNSTFDVKRDMVIKMDMAGQFIPFCTKMAFLKYYTPSDKNQIHFWAQADRDAYIDAINKILADYLTKPIAFN